MPIYTERKLIAPFLFLVERTPGIKMEQIIPQMIIAMKPSGKDAQIAAGRSDTYFSQKVRNLKSHRDNNLMGIYTTLDSNGGYTITEKGLEILEADYEAMKALFYFDITDEEELNKITSTNVTRCKKKVRVFKEDDLITEGNRITKNITILQRSKKLRAFAFQKQQELDDFKCSICGFDFKEKYGDIGKEFIQFHHIKPLSEYIGEELDDQELQNAITNIIPICPNCHCMIHKIKAVDTVSELKLLINGGK